MKRHTTILTALALTIISAGGTANGMQCPNPLKKIKQAIVFVSTNRSEEYLLLAATSGNLEEIKYALLCGADINAIDGWESTALHYATISGYVDIVQYLIEQGAKINSVDNNNQTALHDAARNNHFNIVQYLVEQGADIFLPNKNKMTAYDSAFSRHHTDIASYLKNTKNYLEQGIELTITPENKKTVPNYSILKSAHKQFILNRKSKNAFKQNLSLQSKKELPDFSDIGIN